MTERHQRTHGFPSSMASTTYGIDVDLTSSSNIRAALLGSNKACVINRAHSPFEVVAVNGRWSSLCGYSPDEALGSTPKHLLAGEHTDPIKAHNFAHRCTESPDGARVTLINYTKHGRPFIHKIKLKLFTDPDLHESFYITESCEEHDAGVVRALCSRAKLVASWDFEDLCMSLAWLMGALVVTWASVTALVDEGAKEAPPSRSIPGDAVSNVAMLLIHEFPSQMLF